MIPYNTLIRRLNEHVKIKGTTSWIMRNSPLSYTTFYRHVNHQFFSANTSTHVHLEQLLRQLDNGVDLTPPVSHSLMDSKPVRDALKQCTPEQLRMVSKKSRIPLHILRGYRFRNTKMCNKKMGMKILHVCNQLVFSS